MSYRPEDLGHLIRPPLFGPWLPPPTVVPYEDPFPILRTYRGLRRLGNLTPEAPRRGVSCGRLYAIADQRIASECRSKGKRHG